MKELMGMSHLSWNNDENSGGSCNNQRRHTASPVDDHDVLRPHGVPRLSSVPVRGGYPAFDDDGGQRTRGQAVPFQPRWGSGAVSSHFVGDDCHDPDAWDNGANCTSQVPSATPSAGSRAQASREAFHTSVAQRGGSGRGERRGTTDSANAELVRRQHGPSTEMRTVVGAEDVADRRRGRGRGGAVSRQPPNPGISPQPASSSRRLENLSQQTATPSPSVSSVSSTPGTAAQRAGSAPATKISSMRFDSMRVAPVFAAGGSRFADAYAQGSLPCHIDHGAYKNRIAWDVSVDEIRTRREALLSLCVEGLHSQILLLWTIAILLVMDVYDK